MHELLEALETGPFTAMDFEVSFPDSGSAVFSAVFISKREYFVRLNVGTKSEFTWECCPSKLLRTGREDFSEYTVTGPVRDWLGRIREELRAGSPALREIQEAQAKLEQQIAEHITDPQAHLSSDDLAKIDQRFDAMLAQLQALREKNEITEQELKAVKVEIDRIKENAHTLPKASFVRISVNRLRKLTESEYFKQPIRDALSAGLKVVLGLPQ